MRALIVIAVVVAVSSVAPARTVSAQGPGLSLDATLGGGHAFGGGALNVRGFATLDALLAMGRRTQSVTSTVFGLALNAHGLPFGGSVALLGGAGIYFPEGRTNARGFREDGPTALGLQARIDAASAVKAHLAFLVSLRGAVLPNLNGDSYRLLAFGIGVRLRQLPARHAASPSAAGKTDWQVRRDTGRGPSL